MKVRRLVPLAMVALGLVLAAGAVVQPIKSSLGTSLLDSKFAARLAADPEARADASRWRPWPWAELAPIGELHFPELGERRVVVDSASGEALAWGVGHMAETAQLGAPGVSVVAGHRDGAFKLLGNVHEGDIFELTTLDGEITSYVVEDRVIVDSGRAQLAVTHDGPNELVLTTCWPIDALVSGPDRLVIRARPSGTE